ncbi:FAD-dependent monooxygenase [Glycomyces sp. NPDC049804]|uniref:FAD-dependent monooxygenase n=1 Tax=Glycomyces sp. NPDC049804 TaxID=3154363 RepID=UPI0034133D94
MKPGSAIVIGAGIGGLAAAIALRRTGWTVTVLERNRVAGEIGAGMSQGPNAIRALDALGVGDRARAAGTPFFGTANLREASGRYLNRAEPGTVPPLIGFHRADLHNVLLDAVPTESIRTGAAVTAIDQTPGRAFVHVGDETFEADLVVAADGVRSTARRLLWPQTPEPAFWHYTVWRGIADLDLGPAQGGMTLAKDRYFLTMPLPGGRVYWGLGTRAGTPGERADDERSEVLRRVGDWHDPIPALLDATPTERVLHHDITDLVRTPLPTYVNGRIALLGDAAHPMSPDLGQGAGQALEDAVVLAASLHDVSDATAALARYDTVRRPRTQWIAKSAHQKGAGYISGSAARQRMLVWTTRMMRPATLATMTTKALARIWDWQPPDLPAYKEL